MLRRSSAKIRALLSTGLLVGFGAIGTYAFWSDSAVISTGAFTSGTMDLQFDAAGAIGPGTNYSTWFNWSGLAPGERKAFSFSVENVGDAPFLYSATATRGSTPEWSYVGTPISVQFFRGTVVGDTSYPQQDSCTGAALGQAQLIDGSNKPVIDPGVRLGSNQGDTVCVVIGIDPDATSENQFKTGSVALNFYAKQAQ